MIREEPPPLGAVLFCAYRASSFRSRREDIASDGLSDPSASESVVAGSDRVPLPGSGPVSPFALVRGPWSRRRPPPTSATPSAGGQWPEFVANASRMAQQPRRGGDHGQARPVKSSFDGLLHPRCLSAQAHVRGEIIPRLTPDERPERQGSAWSERVEPAAIHAGIDPLQTVLTGWTAGLILVTDCY